MNGKIVPNSYLRIGLIKRLYSKYTRYENSHQQNLEDVTVVQHRFQKFQELWSFIWRAYRYILRERNIWKTMPKDVVIESMNQSITNSITTK